MDIVYLNKKDLTSLPYLSRRQILKKNAGGISLSEQITTQKIKDAEFFLKKAIDKGHEGLIAKKPDSQYKPGIRGKKWLKIKPTMEPLDLVIVAAEYGYGRRFQWLSDYYLAARDTKANTLCIVARPSKGLLTMK